MNLEEHYKNIPLVKKNYFSVNGKGPCQILPPSNKVAFSIKEAKKKVIYSRVLVVTTSPLQIPPEEVGGEICSCWCLWCSALFIIHRCMLCMLSIILIYHTFYKSNITFFVTWGFDHWKFLDISFKGLKGFSLDDLYLLSCF